jgi:hypothetical protein
LTEYNYDDANMDGMGKACRMHGQEKEGMKDFRWETQVGKRPLGRPRHWWILFKMIIEREDEDVWKEIFLVKEYLGSIIYGGIL